MLYQEVDNHQNFMILQLRIGWQQSWKTLVHVQMLKKIIIKEYNVMS